MSPKKRAKSWGKGQGSSLFYILLEFKAAFRKILANFVLLMRKFFSPVLQILFSLDFMRSDTYYRRVVKFSQKRKKTGPKKIRIYTSKWHKNEKKKKKAKNAKMFIAKFFPFNPSTDFGKKCCSPFYAWERRTPPTPPPRFRPRPPGKENYLQGQTQEI